MGALFQPQSDRERDRQNWTEEKRQEWERQQRIRVQAQKQEQARKIEATDRLESAFAERDRQYRQYIKSRPLSDRHYQNLKERGLSPEAIERGSFGSSESGGMICPAFWGDQIIGFQWRKDPSLGFGQTAGGKYIWSKSPINSKLPNGEMPITVIGQITDGIGNFSEGILKPDIAQSLRSGLWLGAAGGNFPALITQKAIKDFGIKKAIFWPDGGSRVNAHVKASYRNLKALLDKEGIELQFADWGQWDDKSQPDCDELPEGTAIKLKPAAEFFGPLQEANPKRHEFTDEEKQAWKAQQQRQQWEKCYQFTPDRLIQGDWVDLDPAEILGKITAVRAGMGAGKTTALVKLASAFKGKHKILYLGVSNTLLIQTAEKVKGLHFRSEDDEFFFAPDPLGHHLFCIQSLHRFKPQHLEDAIIVLDEATAIIREFVDGSTLTSRPLAEQRFIESNWHDALQHCKAIVALDGYLGDRHCEYLQTVAPHLELTKIAKPVTPKTPIHFHLGSLVEGDVKAGNFSSILKQIIELATQGKRFAIASDSQKTCEALDETLTAMGILEGYRVDSTTVPEDWMKSILKDPNEAILSNKITRFIYSPSAMSGVDISVPDWFDAQFCIFHGVLSADLLSQMVWRIRDCSERHVWVNPKGLGEGGQYTPRAIERTIRFGLAQNLWDSFGEGHGTFDNWQTQLNSPDCRQAYWERAKANYEKANLRECLRWLLEVNGSEVIEAAVEADPEALAQFKNAKDEIKDREAIGAHEADNIDDDEFTRLKKGCNREDRPKVIRHSIRMSLPEIDLDPQWSPEFIRWYLENRDTRSQAKRWFLFQQQETAKSTTSESWIKREGFRAYQFRSYLGEVRALAELGILEVFKTPKSKDDPEVLAIADRWRKDPQIRARLGGRVPAQNPIRSFNWLLRLFGIRLQCVEQHRGKNKKQNLYQIDFSQQETANWKAVARAVTKTYMDKGLQAADDCTSFTCELYKPVENGTEVNAAIVSHPTDESAPESETMADPEPMTEVASDAEAWKGKWFTIAPDATNPRPDWGQWVGRADGEPFQNPYRRNEWHVVIRVPDMGTVTVPCYSVAIACTEAVAVSTA
jgi:flagellar biosynthesis GTPase FlhF